MNFRLLTLLLTLTVCASFAMRAQADLLSISDGEASFDWETNDTGVDGNTALMLGNSGFQFGESWFLEYLGTQVELIGGTVDIGAQGKTASVTFNNVHNVFSVRLGYAIQGNSPSEGSLLTSARVINTSTGGFRNVSLYNYFDYNIGSVDDGHTGVVTIDNDEATTDVEAIGGFVSRRTNDIAHFQLADFGTDGTLYNDIKAGDELDDSGSPFGPGKFTGAYQWDFQIAGGESDSSTQTILFSSVPEPSHAWALLLGVVGFASWHVVRKRWTSSRPNGCG